VAIIGSRKNLESFLIQNQFNSGNYDFNLVDGLIRDTNQSSSSAEESLNEQIKSF
jgi:hypothetical protein